jgi:hypothetical protein
MSPISRRRLLLLAAIAVVPACRGTHPPPRYAWDPKADFAPLKTYAWDDGPGFQPPQGDSIIDGRFIDAHVRTAVDRALEGKGFRKVDAGKADMLVSYRTGNTGVADQDRIEGGDWWAGYAVVTEYEKERSIRIDIRNPAKMLLWRGSITRLEGENPDAVGRELDHEIRVLLGHFPPAPGATPSK